MVASRWSGEFVAVGDIGGINILRFVADLLSDLRKVESFNANIAFAAVVDTPNYLSATGPLSCLYPDDAWFAAIA